MIGRDLELLYSREMIARRVGELADAISNDYQGKTPLLLCVLKGGIVFMADLMRRLRIGVEVDFILASSYEEDHTRGSVDISYVSASDFRNKDVLIVEDIIDTGLTCRALLDHIADRDPASLRLCTLLDKPSRRRSEPVQPDYVGFTIPDRFVVGYGLDYDGKYRELPDICVLV
jgi:hypoxanthine phosphoribosyltransferase